MKKNLFVCLSILFCLFSFSACEEDSSSLTSNADCSPSEIYAKQQLSPDTTIQADFTETVMVNLHEGERQHNVIAHELTYHLTTSQNYTFNLNPSVVETVGLINSNGIRVFSLSSSQPQANVFLPAGTYVMHIEASPESRKVLVVQPQACNSASASTTPSTTNASVSALSVSPNIQTPGVYISYIEETRSVYASSTNVTGFLGVASTGPFNTPVLISSFQDYVETFGALQNNQPMSYAVYEFFLQGGQSAYVVRVNAAGGIPTASEIIGSPSAHTGYYAFTPPDSIDLLVTPDLLNLSPSSAQQVVDSLLPELAEASTFFIVDPPSALNSVDEVLSFKSSLTATAFLSYAALYFPQLYLPAPDLSLALLGAGGNAAGIYANVDNNVGVWISPAGVNWGVLANNVESLSLTLSESDMASLNPAGVNPMISYNGQNLLYGAKTLSSEVNYLYLTQRRLADSIEQSVSQSLQWVVFQSDDQVLWENVTLSISNYMSDLWAAGALYGPTASDSYTVTCDQSNNSAEDILNGILNVTVTYYFSPASLNVLEFSFQTQGD